MGKQLCFLVSCWWVFCIHETLVEHLKSLGAHNSSLGTQPQFPPFLFFRIVLTSFKSRTHYFSHIEKFPPLMRSGVETRI